MEWMTIAIGLLGGLGLFLYGMEMMSDALHQLAGEGMKRVLTTLTGDRVRGLLTGTVFTAVTQSSSVTTVMCVSFVAAGLMTFPQSMGLILGANIGTTITAQLVAFKVTKYAMFLVAGGVLLQMISKLDRPHQWGRVLLGLGLLFVGMETMGDSMRPLRTYEPFVDLMQQMENPILGVLVAAAFTALVQSSSATMGVVIALATQQLITFPAGLALMLGANIGTCVTAGLAAIGRSTEAKRVAGAHVLFNLGGALLVLPFLNVLGDLLGPTGNDTENLARSVANAHTFFNVGMSVVFLPLLSPLALLIEKTIPEESKKEVPVYQTALENDLLEAPQLALAAASRELEQLGRVVLKTYRDSLPMLMSGEEKQLEAIQQSEEEIDKMHDNLVTYLTEIARRQLSVPQHEEHLRLLQMASELEHIGDILETNLSRLMQEKKKRGIHFGTESKMLLSQLHLMTVEALDRTVMALSEAEVHQAKPVLEMKKKMRNFSEMAHLHEARRLEAPDSGGLPAYRIEVDTMEKMEQVFRHTRRLAKLILRERNKEAVSAPS